MRRLKRRGVVWLCAGMVVGLVAAKTLLETPVVGRGTAMPGGRILMATGQIATNHEALYMFDQVTGNLYCYEIREGRRGIDLRGAMRNCLKDLDVSERDISRTKFAMVTGQFDKNTDALFIGESNRGNIAAYRFEDADDGVSFVGRSRLVRPDR